MIGDLNQRVSLLKPAFTPDGGGGYAPAWVEEAAVFADVRGLASGTNAVGGADRVRRRFTFEVRYRDDIDSSYRLSWNGRTFRIIRVVRTTERNNRMTITGSEVFS